MHLRRRGPRRRAAAASAVVGLLLLAGCSDGQVQRSASGTEGSDTGFVGGSGVVTLVPVGERDPAPPFSAPLLGGGSFDLAGEAGQVVVLNVWGSWCAPCRAEAPALQAVSTQALERGVSFVGVNTRDTHAGAAAFLAEFGITYPTVVDTDGRALLAFRATLPPAAIPSTLVVDREGRMAARVVGEITETSLRGLVDTIAAEA